MKISSKSEYGLRALFDLAQHYAQQPRRSREIGEAQGVPEDYLNQILIKLRIAGLITSLRGPQGGHLLARSPELITLLEIIEELEGPIAPVDHKVKPTSLDMVLNEVWSEIEQKTAAVLQATTLADLCERYAERFDNPRQEAMYYI